MVTEINTVVLEDDFFSRNWMSLILARDWRTRVVADVETVEELRSILDSPPTRIDLIIVDTEIYRDLKWIGTLLETIQEHAHTPKVLFTTVSPLPEITYYMGHEAVRGYLTKGEIRYSLAWAVDIAMEGDWVLTPSADDFLSFGLGELPQPRAIIQGQNNYPGLTENQANAARLAFLFSMERAELADELLISVGWSYGKVNELYEKIGVRDLLSGEMPIEFFLGDNPIILSHFRKIIENIGEQEQSKAKNMETLAFHLLTRPMVHRIT
ncbi:MAG: hypothetical protein ISS57_09280 [Anaerolineales bacterium]|nr:hypothetical protein [Anaerolineales bacterium]